MLNGKSKKVENNTSNIIYYMCLVELCPGAAFHFFWECCIVSDSGTDASDRIVNTEVKRSTENVCCVCKKTKEDKD